MGLGAILSAIGLALNQLFDGNPQTTPDWNLLVPQIIAGVGLVLARDNNKSSEDVGLKSK